MFRLVRFFTFDFLFLVLGFVSYCRVVIAIYLIKMASKIWNNLWSAANATNGKICTLKFLGNNNKTTSKIIHSIQFGCRKRRAQIFQTFCCHCCCSFLFPKFNVFVLHNKDLFWTFWFANATSDC